MKKLPALLFGLALLPTAILAYDCSDTLTSGIPEVQCDALVRLYNELDGPNWSSSRNWLVPGTDINSRDQITVSGNNLYRIDFYSNQSGVSGNISSWDGFGTIEIFNMTAGGTNNSIKRIPSSWSGLDNIKDFKISAGLEEIPDSWNGLETLERLSIYNDKITELPDSREGLNSVRSLSLNNNELTELPSSRTHLDSITFLALHVNQITSIPNSWAGLGNGNISNINLETNQINQNFPTSDISGIYGAELYIRENKIYGNIPNEMTNIPNGTIVNNYFNTDNVSEPLLSHLDANFSEKGNPRSNQNKAMTMYFPSLNEFLNHITSIAIGTYTNIEIDCTTSTKENARSIAGGYDQSVDAICGDSESGTKTINMVKFK